MKYAIRITKKAEQDINGAADYIEFILMNPKAANDLLEDIDEEINSLASMSERYRIVNDPVLEAWEIRLTVINNYIAFYRINEKNRTVEIIRFLYGKRNWISILSKELPDVDLTVGIKKKDNTNNLI